MTPPWSPASQIGDKQGLCMGLYSFPGAGKTTLGTTLVDTQRGSPLLVINFDGEVRSIGNRDDIQIWPGEEYNGQVRSWSHFTSFNRKLVSNGGPFKSFMFDTISNAYPFAYEHVLANQGGHPSKDPRADFGKANDLILQVLTEWSRLSRERGYNVLFNVHGEEKQVGENGPLVWRPTVTPGVVKGIYARVSMVGFLQEVPSRKLILRNTMRVIAKMHQPRNGGIPLEIPNPSLAAIINHIHGEPNQFPKPEKKTANARPKLRPAGV